MKKNYRRPPVWKFPTPEQLRLRDEQRAKAAETKQREREAVRGAALAEFLKVLAAGVTSETSQTTLPVEPSQSPESNMP